MGVQKRLKGKVTVDGALTAVDGIVLKTSSTSLTDSTNHFTITSTAAGKTVRINSRTSTDSENSLIGFQSKPALGVASANNVIGGEISPRVNDTFALTGSGSLIGLHVDAYLKGTTGDIAGDVRVLQLELVDDGSSTRTVTGDAVGIRFRNALSCTVTGTVTPILIENGELATKWEALAKIENETGVFQDTGTASTQSGALKVIVNGNTRYIALYTTLS